METLENILRRQWLKRDGTPDERMVDYCLKSSKYIELNGAYIDCGDAKPSIDKTMWYDDETDGPQVNFESFRRYNRNHFLPMLSETTEFGARREIWITIQYYSDRSDGKLLGVTTKSIDEPKRNCEIRKATIDEIAAINKARAEVNENYEKRLKTYWKRYSDKVHASGYWVNR